MNEREKALEALEDLRLIVGGAESLTLKQWEKLNDRIKNIRHFLTTDRTLEIVKDFRDKYADYPFDKVFCVLDTIIIIAESEAQQ